MQDVTDKETEKTLLMREENKRTGFEETEDDDWFKFFWRS